MSSLYPLSPNFMISYAIFKAHQVQVTTPKFPSPIHTQTKHDSIIFTTFTRVNWRGFSVEFHCEYSTATFIVPEGLNCPPRIIGGKFVTSDHHARPPNSTTNPVVIPIIFRINRVCVDAGATLAAVRHHS